MYKNIIVTEEPTENSIVINKNRLTKIKEVNITCEDEFIYADVRGCGELKGKAIYLSDETEWVLGKDSQGCTVLIPLKLEVK